MPFRLTNTSGTTLKLRGRDYPANARVIADELTPEQLVTLQRAGWAIIDTETNASPDTGGVGGFNTGSDGFMITPTDAKDFATVARSVYVGEAGDVSLITDAGTTLVFANVPAGTTIPMSARAVNETGTTASALIGLL